MDNLNKIEIAARNKANYLKAKETFNIHAISARAEIFVGPFAQICKAAQ